MAHPHQALTAPPYGPTLRIADGSGTDESSPAEPDLWTRLVTPEEVAERLRTSRANVYVLLGKGELRSIQIGRSRRVVLGDLAAYIDRLRGSAE